MKPIDKAWLIQIEITNCCVHECANCTRFVGQHQKPFFMDLATVEKAIDSLEGYAGGIGIMGGEPTVHPKFREICELLQKKVPMHRCGLWTSGHRWDEYKDLIKQTFKLGIYYNDHTEPNQRHQPVLVAIDEVVQDKKLMWELINKCWVQEQWSPSITPKGGFFCEVAAAIDAVFDGPGGYPLEKGWWRKDPKDYQDQVKRCCVRCGGALPLDRPLITEPNDTVTPKNLEALLALKAPKALNGRVTVFNKQLTREELQAKAPTWNPSQYLENFFARKKNLKLDELKLLRGFHGCARMYNKFAFHVAKALKMESK